MTATVEATAPFCRICGKSQPRFRVVITHPSGKEQDYRDSGLGDFTRWMAEYLVDHLTKTLPRRGLTGRTLRIEPSPDLCEDGDEWLEAIHCDQCGKKFTATDRDPDCVGCGSYAPEGE